MNCLPSDTIQDTQLSWRAQAYKMEVEEGGYTKRKKGQFPLALADPQALQNVLLELQSVQDEFPSQKQKKKGQLATSARLASSGSFSPPGANCKIVAKLSSYRPAVSRSRQVMSDSGAWLALVWRLVVMASCVWCCLCVTRRFLLRFLLFSLLFRVTRLSELLEQSFPSTKRTEKWGSVVYLDQCNPKCIYLQK